MKTATTFPYRLIENSFNRIISFTLSFCLIILTFNSFSQAPDSWVQKADFGGTARTLAAGFSIGTKGYIGTGLEGATESTVTKDFWEWDQATNVWTQKADFGGTARYNATGFSIGNKGYIGTGIDGGVTYYTKDFWEYDPSINTWVQKADFGGTARQGAVGFSISGKGYLGTGNDGSFINDFWEYNPGNNTWNSIASLPGPTRNSAISFSIGTKGYVGTGYNGTRHNDFWEYDQSTNIWAQKANFGGAARAVALGFSIGNNGYIGLGHDGSSFLNDLWKWDQQADTWIQLSNFPGFVYSGVAFSIGSKSYVGTGITPTGYSNDFWEYTAETPICPGTLAANAGPDTTVYYGYAPEECTTLNGLASGGAEPYSYSWNTGATTASITVCPTDSTSYTLTVTDANGCSKSDEVIVKAIDVHCNNKDKVKICHNPGPNQVVICVSLNAVSSLLAQGDYLGECGRSASMIIDMEAPLIDEEKPLVLHPNPTTGLFSFEIYKKNLTEEVNIKVVNHIGQIVYAKISNYSTEGFIKETIELNSKLANGIYFLKLIIGDNVQTAKIILTR